MSNAPAKPEIDPELAEMEANAVHKFIDGLMGKIGGKGKGVPTNGPQGKPPSDRSRRRALLRMGQPVDPKTVTHGRVGRLKPVKSQFQENMEFRNAARSELVRIKLTTIQPQCPDVKYIIGTPGIRNVWQLSQAPAALIHSIPGLGPKRRQAVLKYLRDNQVPVVWVA